MKNPFIKNDHSAIWISAFLAGAIAAGTVAYLYFTENGFGKAKEIEEAPHEHATDYLKPKPGRKKHKTDLRELEALAHVHHEG